MKKVILIMGHLAALKTTIAKQIASDLNLMYFCKDDIKEILADQIGYRDRGENLKLSKATFQVMSHAIFNLNHEGILLLESNFKYHELEILKEEHHDVKFMSLFLTGNVDVLYDRYLRRQKDRHMAHTSTGVIPYDVFKVSMFEYIPEKLLGQSYLIDTIDPKKTYIDIKNRISDFIHQGLDDH